MKSAERIALLTPGFPVNEQDFLCIPPLQDVLRAMRGMNGAPEIAVIAFQYPYQPVQYRWEGMEVEGIGGNNRRFPSKWFTWKRARQAFARLHSEKPFTHIHSLWLGECARVGAQLAAKFQLPHFCTAMGQDVKKDNRYLRWLPLDKMKIAAVSRRASEELYSSTGRKADAILPWGINPAEVVAPAATRDIDLLGVGSFTSLKSFEEWMEAAALIKQKRGQLKAVLVGYGPQEEQLKSKAGAMGLQGEVHFTGLIPRKEIFQLMARSRVLLHPSRYESFGAVFLEAMAHGVNIISRPVGIAEQQSGWQLAEAVEEMAAVACDWLGRPHENEPVLQATAAQIATRYLQFWQGRL